jgi:hypothetical protein
MGPPSVSVFDFLFDPALPVVLIMLLGLWMVFVLIFGLMFLFGLWKLLRLKVKQNEIRLTQMMAEVVKHRDSRG